MFKKLKALWYMPETLEAIGQGIGILITRTDPQLLGVTKQDAFQDRIMLREVHNMITTRLEPYLQAESDRIGAEAIAKMEANARIIVEKGEKLKPTDFKDVDDDIHF